MSQLVIIGGGTSIEQGIKDGLFEKIKNKFVIGCNGAFLKTDVTMTITQDPSFAKKYTNELNELPLIVTSQHYRIGEILSNTHIFTLKTGETPFKSYLYVSYLHLTGIMALSLACEMLEVGEIFLLGYDWYSKYGKTNFHNFNKSEQLLDYDKSASMADEVFFPFKQYTNIKIWNVSPFSNITIFDKLNYNQFYKKLIPVKINQDIMRLKIKDYLRNKIERDENGS